jgi:hypothetical protein
MRARIASSMARWDVVVAQQVGHRHRGVDQVPGHPGRVLGLGQPRRRPLGRPGRPDALDDGVAGQQVLLDEVAQRLAEAVLALGDHRGVGDGQAPSGGGTRR